MGYARQSKRITITRRKANSNGRKKTRRRKKSK